MLFHKELLIPFNCKLYLSNPFVKINMMSGLGTWSLLVDKLFVSQTCYFFVSYQIICTVGRVHDSQREMKKFAENSLIIIFLISYLYLQIAFLVLFKMASEVRFNWDLQIHLLILWTIMCHRSSHITSWKKVCRYFKVTNSGKAVL